MNWKQKYVLLRVEESPAHVTYVFLYVLPLKSSPHFLSGKQKWTESEDNPCKKAQDNGENQIVLMGWLVTGEVYV